MLSDFHTVLKLVDNEGRNYIWVRDSSFSTQQMTWFVKWLKACRQMYLKTTLQLYLYQEEIQGGRECLYFVLRCSQLLQYSITGSCHFIKDETHIEIFIWHLCLSPCLKDHGGGELTRALQLPTNQMRRMNLMGQKQLIWTYLKHTRIHRYTYLP